MTLSTPRTIALLCLLAASVCARAQDAPEPLTPAQRMELDTLAGQLGDPDRSLKTRIEAAELLLTRDYPQAATTLGEVLNDAGNRQGQIAVAEAIARQAAERGVFVEPLMKMLTGKEPSVREPAARALVTFKNHGVTDRLVAIATDAQRDRAVRLVAIGTLQRVLDKRAVDALIGLLDDDDAAVRDAAVDALEKLTNIRTFDGDVTRWREWWRRNKDRDRSEWLADLAESLGRANAALQAENDLLRDRLMRATADLYAATPPQAQDELLLSLLRDPLPAVRLTGAKLTDRRLQGGGKVPDAVRAQVRGMLADADPRVRESAALLLANLGDGQAAAALLERLDAEEVAAARAAVLTALGQLRDPAAVPAILREIDSRYEPVAAAAANALARVAAANPLDAETRAKASEALTGRYEQADRSEDGARLREALLVAMSYLGDKSLASVLEGALKDSAATVRLAAVNGLAQLGASDSAPAVAPLAGDPDRGVRRAAIVALKTLGGVSQLAAILQRTDPAVEPDADVRQQAWDATMDILAKAPPEVLAGVVDDLADRGDAADERIRIMRLWVEALASRKSERLPIAQRRLGAALVAAARPAEAAGYLAEAHEAMSRADAPDAGDVWAEWVRALLAAGKPQAMRMMAEQEDAAAFAEALAQLTSLLTAAQSEGDFLTVIALTTEALRELPQRLTAEQQERFRAMLSAAELKQSAADRDRVVRLTPQLAGADAAAAKAAAAELAGMGRRAIDPLLDELRKVVSADSDNGELESAVVAVLRQIAPGVNGYDASAAKDKRLARIEAWRRQLTTRPSE